MRGELAILLALLGVVLISGCAAGTTTYTAADGVWQERAASMRMPQGNLMDVFPRVYAVTQSGLHRHELKILCQEIVNEIYVSFVGPEEGSIFLVAFTRDKFEAPGKNLYTHRGKDGIPPGGTQDWGYIFDRNHDGKVDYLAFLDGPNPVVPDDWDGYLPSLKKPSGLLKGKDLIEIIQPNTELLFWHLADDNYDGQHDGMAVSIRDLESLWIDGWVVARDKNFDGRYESCKYFKGRLNTELGDCQGTEAEYHVPNKKPSGVGRIPYTGIFLTLINAAAEKCHFSADSFQRRSQ